MSKRLIVALALLAAAPLALANFSNGPEESGAVFRANFPFGLAFVDAEAGLVALGGPPPELGCLGEGFEDADHQVVETPAGPVKVLIHDIQQFFIYEASSIGEVCIAALTTGIRPLAVGYANVFVNDSFVNYQPGQKARTIGGNANGLVYDGQGNPWSFHGNVKLLLDKEGNFSVLTETVKLNMRGK